ncbi:MAG: DNA polymerase III subunit delta [Ignavibacteria bacterium]|nr:DNA polymerase III subunit delta [Ignavibacteria bacterium]
MRTFQDFRNEVSSGKLKNVYYIASIDNYFLSKAGEILREKLFGSKENKENFFLKYADETPMQELFDLTSGGASLFSAQKLVIVKRCEKYSRKLSEFIERTKEKAEDSYILYAFDTSFVIEKKLHEIKGIEFYDFSDLPQRELYDWVKQEFESYNIKINNDALDLFITSVPSSFDLLSTEIEKISNYDFEGKEPVLTKEIILQFIGYDREYSPDELMTAIVNKDQNRAFSILNNLLNSKALNEVYLLSTVSNYYMDLFSFKTQGLDTMDSRTLYQRYKMWGDRVKFAKNYHKLLNISSLEHSFAKILETDKKLKTSMLDPKILMTSLVEELINA